MAGCLPEYFVTGVFEPDLDIPFIPGATPSNLISVLREEKARLFVSIGAGGTGVLFRAKDNLIGTTGNSITVQSEWFTGLNGTGGVTTNPASALSVKLTISHPGFTTETHIENQSLTSGSPIIGTPNAIGPMRTWVNANSLIVDMPTTDVESGFSSGTDDGNYLSFFGPSSLSGGQGDAPADPISAGVRTGPIYAFYHIFESEFGRADGTFAVLNEKRVWDGSAWVPFNPPLTPSHVEVPNGENRGGSPRFILGSPLVPCP